MTFSRITRERSIIFEKFYQIKIEEGKILYKKGSYHFFSDSDTIRDTGGRQEYHKYADDVALQYVPSLDEISLQSLSFPLYKTIFWISNSRG